MADPETKPATSLEAAIELSVQEALDRYMEANSKLPKEGKPFHGPGYAEAFSEVCRAKCELERAYERAGVKS